MTPYGHEHDAEEEALRPFTVKLIPRRLKSPLRLPGDAREVTLYRAPEVIEYCDTSTGEILRADVVHRSRNFTKPIHFSELVLQREAILKGLRQEVRDFAVFVLKFRDQRRGITPGINTLVKWYADLTGKETFHVKRYLPQLTKAGILAGESLVGPLFQVAGRRTTARDHLAAPAVAGQRYADCRRKWMNHPVSRG